MSTLTVSGGQFLHTHTTNNSGDYTISLSTQNTFVDKNIAIKITTPVAGTLGLALTDSSNSLTVGTLNNNKYPFTATLGGTVTAATAGWISNTGISVSDSVVVGTLNKATFARSENKFYCNSAGYIAEGSADSPLLTIDKVTPTASIDTGTSNNYNGLTTYFNTGTSSSYDVAIKPRYTNSAGYVEAHTNSITTANITYWQIKTTSPTFSAAPDGGATASFSNITTGSTDNGIKIQTAYTINATTIKYAAAVSAGWLTGKSAGATTGSSTTAKASTDGETYYITAITVPATKNFTLTMAANSNSDSSKLTLNNNTNRNVEIPNNTGNIYARQTTSGKGNVYVRPYGASADTQIINNGSMLTSSVATPTWTKNSTTKVATMKNSTWSNGYITQGTLSAATFKNTATSGKTYVDLSDALTSAGGANVIPEIIADSDGNRYLYIDRGYIDYVKISLARLIPDADSVTALAANYILQGHSAYDIDGNLISGTITSKTAATYYPSTQDQTIAAEQYLSGAQTIKAVTLANISAANIKYNVTVEVGDADDSDRITAVTGTFTAKPSDKNALTANSLRTGYAGFINGQQVNGSMPDISVTPSIANQYLTNYLTTEGASSSSYDVRLTPQYKNTTAGYLAAHTSATGSSHTYYKIKVASITGAGGALVKVADTTDNSIYKTGADATIVDIVSSAPATDSGYVYFKVNASGTATVSTAGWVTESTAIASGVTTHYIKIIKYDGTYTES